MHIADELNDCLKELFHAASEHALTMEDFKKACEFLQIARLSYDMDIGKDSRYRDPRTNELMLGAVEKGGRILLYEHGEVGETLIFPYFYDGVEFCHAYVGMKVGVDVNAVDMELMQYMADTVYVLVSRQNMRIMLDLAEVTDAQTGIPNVLYIRKKYHSMIEEGVSPDSYAVLYANLQNFKYLNEVGGARCGDEGIVRYARFIMNFFDKQECVCRMGGDNFVMFVKVEHLQQIIDRFQHVVLSNLTSAPNRTFEISAWIGISMPKPGVEQSFRSRLEEAAVACNMGKARLRRKVVEYSGELADMINRGRQIMSMFHPAVTNHEIQPFFQAKVNMETGELVGFEALCRWIHEGRFIFPDQFIPVLEKEDMMFDLDMTMLRETCRRIRQWKESGLKPPRISVNCSRKNLLVKGIEDKIPEIVEEFGVDPGSLEIEITESAKEKEQDRLIEFVLNMKAKGFHVAIDDFGTGYSSLSLIHNINADVIKIDKSFVDVLLKDRKSEILIESIVNISQRLQMEVIAEGIETKEQAKLLVQLGCPNAQGYYYSKPVDFDQTTEILKNPGFQPIYV